MYPVLYRIPWDGIPLGGGRLPIFGWGVLLVLWVLVAAWSQRALIQQAGRWVWPDVATLVLWIVVAAVIVQAPVFGARMAPEGMPINGYGTMLLIGLLAAIRLAERRARAAGLSGELIWDLAVSIFIPGIIGARLFYLVQYHQRVYAGAKSPVEYLIATINLTEGGIVLYGGLVAGAIAYLTFCALRKLPPLTLADIITPSVFVGIGFGRIGCLLFGCCFGDACDLPWAITFPRDSVPYMALVERGFLAPDAPLPPPLHPTQIYSAIDGFLIAGLTLWYHRFRKAPGDVFSLGLILSSATRFCIEFLRGDEYGQWGTALTIAQWISVGLFLIGIGLQVWLHGGYKTAVPAARSA